MFSPRLPVLSLLGSIGCAGAVLLADTIAAAFVPPAPVNPDVPPQVRAAIVVSREARAAWPPATPITPPSGAPAVPMPAAAPAALCERTLCAFVDNPAQVLLRRTIAIGMAGTILFFVGFFVFIVLRETLKAFRNWRLSIGAKLW